MQWPGDFLHRRRRLDDLSVSIQEHLDEKTEELMAAGMSREQAGQTARREFGNVTLMEERGREVWQWGFRERLRADLKFAWRQAVRSPLFTMAAVATLAVGIGAQSAVYSVVHAVLIDPYPYRGAMRMVHLHLYDKDPFPEDLALTSPQFAQFKTSPVLDGAIAEDMFSLALTGGDLPEQVGIGRMSPDAFQFFDVPAELGRAFTPADPLRVAVLSYGFWKSHYAARADVLGKSLQLDHVNYTILGVMPRRFAWTGQDVYTPLEYSADPHRMANVYARVREGISDQAAEQALQPLLDQYAKDTPANFPQRFKVHLVHINEVAIGRFSGVLVILFISVSFLLVLACVNVAILLLARGEARQAEFAMRKALGASRRRVVAQLLTESILLSSVGGGTGVLLALGGIRLVRHFIAPLPSLFPPETDIALNVPVLLFSVFMALLTGVLCGLWPALRIARTDLRRASDALSHKLAGNKSTHKTHMVLLTVEVAVTILLLACSGATVRKLSQLIHANLGYDPAHLFSVNLELREGAHTRWADRVHYFEQLRAAIASDPNIASAAIGFLPPNVINSTPISIPSLRVASGHVIPMQVSPEYFSTLRIPLLHGRVFSAEETAHVAHEALINEAMQRRYWPNADPMGQTIILNNGVANGNAWTLVAPGNNQTFQVIGVVGDSPNQGLDEQAYPAVYLPYAMKPSDGFDVVFRANGEAANLLHSIKEHVSAVESGQAVSDLSSATNRLEGDGLGRERFVATLFGVFAILALTFAVSGLYCIQSYLVARRTAELGVRLALGARRYHIVRLVTSATALAVLAGTAIGVVLSLTLGRIFAQWTNGNVGDPAMLAAVAALLFVAAGLASIGPALMAIAISPIKSLQAQ